MRINPFKDDSDQSWDWFGRKDPYYGVFSAAEYRQEHLTDENLQRFFESGVNHVDRVLNVVEQHLGPIPMGNCLDFGCGVGRLAIPFAKKFPRVSAVDISPAMILEANKNCSKFGINNVSFYPSLAEAPGRYDLVHTYVVIQHIPVNRGLVIIDELINRLSPSGAAFLHLTIGRNAGVLRDIATSIRKNIQPLHRVLNVLEGKRFADAYMQSNRYELNPLLAHLYDRGIKQIWMEVENHGGPYSVCMAFRRGESQGG